MNDERILALDGDSLLVIEAVDCLAAATALARGHLSGPTASTYLAQALAGVALLGMETSRADETVTFRLDCPGPLGGLLVECTEKGTLRGCTKKKILDFDGERFSDAEVIGASATVEVIRSVPGKVLSSAALPVNFVEKGFKGIRGVKGAKGLKGAAALAQALEAYFAQSLQRRVRVALCGASGDDGVPTVARGVLVECPPDGDETAFARVSELFANGVAAKAIGGATLSLRTLLRKLCLPRADVRATAPIAFACRCGLERAQAMLDALDPAERASLPPMVDITCHLCGRTWTVRRD